MWEEICISIIESEEKEMIFLHKTEVIEALQKLRDEKSVNMASSIIYSEVINEAIMRIMELKAHEENNLICSSLILQRELLHLEDNMILNKEVTMKDGKKYRITCEVI